MAKDGTNHGGARIGAGRPRKSKKDKVLEGDLKTVESQCDNSKAKVKPPKKYLSAKQQDGGKLCGKRIYKETQEWIAAHGCRSFVPAQLVEEYAMTIARRIQCEDFLSKYGLIAKHPTTGEPTASPFVKMSVEYSKLASQQWGQIYAIVRDNATGFSGDTEDPMEQLFFRRVK